MSNSNQQITTPTQTGLSTRPFKLSLFGRIRRWAYQRAVRNGLNDKQLLNLPPTPEYIYCATTLGVAEKINYDLPSNNWICIVNHPGQLEIKTALLLLGTHQRIIAKRSSQSSLQVTLNKYLLNEMFIYTDQIDTPEKMREIIGTEIAQGTLYTIAIEGTRNYGIGLRRGQPGIVRILSSVPNINILPVAVYMDEYDDSMLSTFFKKVAPLAHRRRQGIQGQPSQRQAPRQGRPGGRRRDHPAPRRQPPRTPARILPRGPDQVQIHRIPDLICAE